MHPQKLIFIFIQSILESYCWEEDKKTKQYCNFFYEKTFLKCFIKKRKVNFSINF